MSVVEQYQGPGPLQSLCLSCCCIKAQDRDLAPQWMLKDITDPPSLFAHLCFCTPTPVPRFPNDIEKVLPLRGLAGITFQDGDHTTEGSMETLRYAHWYPATRTLVNNNFGGFWAPSAMGLWTEPTAPLWKSLMWMFLQNASRVAGYQYTFKFSEDLRFADIYIQGNPFFMCCCCCPFIPPWFTVPKCIMDHSMVQAEDSIDGTHWVRYAGFLPGCGGRVEPYYDLRTAWYADGQISPHHHRIYTEVPKVVQVTF